MMEKIKREIHSLKMEESRKRTIDFVLSEIDSSPRKSRSFRLYLKPKMVISTLLVITIMLTISILNSPTDNPNPPGGTIVNLSDNDTVVFAEVSYITGNLLSHSFTTSNMMRVNNTNETEFEQDIEQFNVYFDFLKTYIDEEDFSNDLVLNEGQNGYNQQIVFHQDGQEFVLNITIEGTDITGEMLTNNLAFDVSGTYEKSGEQVELKLRATSGNDYIEIEYKLESKDSAEKKFEITQMINNVLTIKEIKVEISELETKVEIIDNEDSYELKKEFEDGEYVYKLEYTVNGVTGEATIVVDVDEFGIIVFRYAIIEDGKYKEIDLDDPDNEDTSSEQNQDLKNYTV